MGVFDLHPSSQWTSNYASEHIDYSFVSIPLGKINFWAYLGHTLGGVPGTIKSWGTDGADLDWADAGYFDPSSLSINWASYSDSPKPRYNGWTFGGVNYHHEGTNDYIAWYPNYEGDDTTLKIGCFMLGRYFDMPHSPELKLTMSREMDGVKRVRTKGGSDLVNHKYIKPPLWGDLAPWEHSGGGYSQKLSRVGRRIWDLSWNYLDGGSLFGPNQAIRGIPPSEFSQSAGGPIEDDDLSAGNEWVFNLLTDDNWFSQVWSKSLGGTLPFLFQPDMNNNNEWAIARFKNSTLKATQTSPGLYDIAVSIEEAW